MRVFHIMLMVGLLCTVEAGAEFMGIKAADEYVAMPVHPPLDSTCGIPRAPDSIHVITYADNAVAPVYRARSVATPFDDIGIDTSSQYGATQYWLVAQIQDVDGDGGMSSLGIQVATWYHDVPTYSFGTVQVLADSLGEMLAATRDSAASASASAGAVRDTAQYLVTATAVDVAQISGDAMAADNLETMLDGTGGQVLTLGRVVIDGANGGDGSLLVRNSSGDAVRFISTGGEGSGLYAMGAGGGEGIKAIGGITGGNGLQAIGGAGGGDFCGVFFGDIYGSVTPADTNRSGYTLAVMPDDWSAADSTGFQGEAAGLNKADIADTLIKSGMVRYSAPDSILQLRGLHLVGTTPGDTAIKAIGNGSGHGAYFGSSGTGDGGVFRGGLISGHGIIGWTTDGHGMALYGSREKSGLYCEAIDSGAGAYFMGGDEANGGDYGPGIRIRGRVDDGLYISADDGDRLDINTRKELVRTMWGYAMDTTWAAGSFGDSAKHWTGGTALGSGSYPLTMTTFDSGIAAIIPGVRVSVFNADLSALVAIGVGDESGSVQFHLDAGAYVATAFAPGYIFSPADTIEVSGSCSDTLWAERFDPGTPALPELCRVYGYIYGIDGRPIEGVEVEARLGLGGIRNGGLIVSPYRRTAMTDSIGYFYLDLLPSASLTPAGTPYDISAVYPAGTVLRKQVQVPDQATWQLSW